MENDPDYIPNEKSIDCESTCNDNKEFLLNNPNALVENTKAEIVVSTPPVLRKRTRSQIRFIEEVSFEVEYSGLNSQYKSYHASAEYREIRNKKLTCGLCKKLCNSRRELMVHTNSHKDTNNHCPVCCKFIPNSQEKLLHGASHTERRKFICSTCLCSFNTEEEVTNHQQSEHKKSINLIMECMFCPFSTRSQDRYTRHMTRYHMDGCSQPKSNPFNVEHVRSVIQKWLSSFPVCLQEVSSTGKDSVVKYYDSNVSISSAETDEMNLACDETKLTGFSMLDVTAPFDNESFNDLEEYLEKTDFKNQPFDFEEFNSRNISQLKSDEFYANKNASNSKSKITLQH